LNREIDKLMREIKRKCRDTKQPLKKSIKEGRYPGYCRRAVLDLLKVLDMMRSEYADIENKVENVIYLNELKQIDIEDVEAYL